MVSDLEEKEKGGKGFKQYMVAMHFLWARPKNASILASAMDISTNDACGLPLWKWIARISSLKAIKIQGNFTVDEIYGISADGVDFKIWERKHPQYNIDTKACLFTQIQGLRRQIFDWVIITEGNMCVHCWALPWRCLGF